MTPTDVGVPAYLERGTGSTALVFLHGIGGGQGAWPHQIDHFATRGYRTVAWDMPGYGDSATIAPYTMGGAADALARLVDRLGAKRNIIVGHSLGGMVAQEFAGAHPARCHGLVLFATSPAFGKSDGDWQRDFVAARLKPLDAGQSMATVAAALVPAMLGEHPAPDARSRAESLMARVPPATYRSALQALCGFDRREWLARIAVPTLVLAGERDPNAPAAVMRKMSERIPHARYVEIAGAGHLANLERAGEFNAILENFLAEFFAA